MESASVGPAPVRAMRAVHRPDPHAAWPRLIDTRLAALQGRVPHSAERPDPALRASLDAIAADIEDGTKIGISVRDLGTGASLFDFHGDEPLNPASNHKLLAATAAIELLGADYRFETTFAREGDTLYVMGGGDPSLQVEDIESIASTLAASMHGVQEIVVDESFFSARRFGPGYDENGPGHSYMAPSGPLSLQFNTVMVTVRPGRAGEPVEVTTFPACEQVEIDSTAITMPGQGLHIDTERRGDATVVTVRGALAAGRTPVSIRRRIHDPGRYAASALAAAIARRTGELAPSVRIGSMPAGLPALHVHRSAPLHEVLTSALKWSNNFSIEQVLRTLGRLASGQPGDWNNGGDVLHRFWNALGEDPQAIAFENAAGLSASGRVTAAALTDLAALWRDGHGVVGALPVAGIEGTLRGRLSKTHGRVRAKTGTLPGASALTGVVTDDAGAPRVAFAVIVNGSVSRARAQRLQDQVVYALVQR
jgi:D-alanyl-D-alanine carboxypeptidase/D-alanyl-D-alanine-endopeptidase (penicillin-binding protein 4)